MGNCCKPELPSIETEADNNRCCDDLSCPSTCCIIQIRRAPSQQQMEQTKG